MNPLPQLAADRAALSGVTTGVVFVGGTAASLARSDVPYPRPGSDATTIRGFFQGNRRAARTSAVTQLVSAVTLGRFAASVVQLAGSAGRGSRALQAAAAIGGATAVASLAGSGLLTAALTRKDAGSDAETVALHRRAFLSGGVVHGVGSACSSARWASPEGAPACCPAAWRGPPSPRAPRACFPPVPPRRAGGLADPGREVLRPAAQRLRRGPHGARTALSRGGLTRCDG